MKTKSKWYPLLLIGLVLILASWLTGCTRPAQSSSPTIAFSPSSLTFSVQEGGANPPSQTLNVWNSGGGTLSWSLSENATWLSLSLTSGASAGETDSITALVDIYGMDAGNYAATITISAPRALNSNQTIAVNLSIREAPQRKITLADAPVILDMSLDLPIRFKHTDAASEGLSNKDLELGPEFSEVELFYSEEPFEIVLAFMVIEESELMQAAANSFFRDEEQMKSTLFYYLEEGVAREGFAVTNAKVDITYPNIGELTVLGSANAVCNGFYLGVDMLAFKNDEVYVFVYEYYYKEHLPLLPCLTGINQRIEAFRKS